MARQNKKNRWHKTAVSAHTPPMDNRSDLSSLFPSEEAATSEATSPFDLTLLFADDVDSFPPLFDCNWSSTSTVQQCFRNCPLPVFSEEIVIDGVCCKIPQ
jgi:hypothetical protein